jgi:hypothetical protein
MFFLQIKAAGTTSNHKGLAAAAIVFYPLPLKKIKYGFAALLPVGGALD